MSNRLVKLPEEILHHIYKYCYNNVIQQIKDDISYNIYHRHRFNFNLQKGTLCTENGDDPEDYCQYGILEIKHMFTRFEYSYELFPVDYDFSGNMPFALTFKSYSYDTFLDIPIKEKQLAQTMECILIHSYY